MTFRPAQVVWRYLQNLGYWAGGFPRIYRYWRDRVDPEFTRMRAVKYALFWFWDHGLSALTGHDPRESLSSMIYKDRRTKPGRLLYRFLEWLDEGHGMRAVNRHAGEGSVDNWELPRTVRFVLVIFWLAVLVALLARGTIRLTWALGMVASG